MDDSAKGGTLTVELTADQALGLLEVSERLEALRPALQQACDEAETRQRQAERGQSETSPREPEDPRIPTSVVWALDEPTAFREEWLMQEAIRAQYDEAKVITAQDPDCPGSDGILFQALVYRRRWSVGILWLCWPGSPCVQPPALILGREVALYPQRAEFETVFSNVRASVAFADVCDALRHTAEGYQQTYRVKRSG